MKKKILIFLFLPITVFSQTFLQVKISSEHLNLRKDPNDTSLVVKKLRKNQNLIKISEEENWVKVVTQNRDTGYVFKKYTTKLNWIKNKEQINWDEKKIKQKTTYIGEIKFNEVDSWQKDTTIVFVDAGKSKTYVYYEGELLEKTTYTYDKYGRNKTYKKEEYQDGEVTTVSKQEKEFKNQKCYQSPTTIKYKNGDRDVLKQDTNTCKTTHVFWYNSKEELDGKIIKEHEKQYPWRLKKIKINWGEEETEERYVYDGEKLKTIYFLTDQKEDSLVNYNYYKQKDENKNNIIIKTTTKKIKTKEGWKTKQKKIFYVKEKNLKPKNKTKGWTKEHDKNVFKKEEKNFSNQKTKYLKTIYKRDKHKNIKEVLVYNEDEELVYATKNKYKYQE